MFNRIETKPEFQAVGIWVTARYEDTSEIPSKWQEFVKRMDEIGNAVNSGDHLGIAMRDGKEDFDYLIGLEVSSADHVPDGMKAVTVPTHEYAVFTHKGLIGRIGETYQYIYGEWLPQSEYNRAPAPFTEVYGEKFCNGATDDSECEIWIPIVKK